MTNPKTRVDSALDQGGDVPNPVCLRDAVAAMERHGDLRDGDTWGRWTWNEHDRTLDYTAGIYAGAPYSVDVEGILDADDPDAEAWDWVRHVAAKRWDPPAIRCLVEALSEVLRQRGGGR